MQHLVVSQLNGSKGTKCACHAAATTPIETAVVKQPRLHHHWRETLQPVLLVLPPVLHLALLLLPAVQLLHPLLSSSELLLLLPCLLAGLCLEGGGRHLQLQQQVPWEQHQRASLVAAPRTAAVQPAVQQLLVC